MYGNYCRGIGRTINKIYVDGSNASFIRSLKIQIGEDEDDEEIIKEAKAKKLNYPLADMHVILVNFSTEHKLMLTNCKLLMERNGGYKEATSYDDVFDAFRLALKHFYVAPSSNEIERNRTKALIFQK